MMMMKNAHFANYGCVPKIKVARRADLMKTNGNSNLITGGGSVIGRAFGEAFHKLGNEVIIAGRRKQALDKAATANPGLETAVLDIENPSAIKSFAPDTANPLPNLPDVLHPPGLTRAD